MWSFTIQYTFHKLFGILLLESSYLDVLLFYYKRQDIICKQNPYFLHIAISSRSRLGNQNTPKWNHTIQFTYKVHVITNLVSLTIYYIQLLILLFWLMLLKPAPTLPFLLMLLLLLILSLVVVVAVVGGIHHHLCLLK